MKRMISIFACSMLAAFLNAQGLTLEALETRWGEEVAAVNARHLESLEGLKRNYLAALLRFEARARSESDLDGVLEAQREITRLDEIGELAPAVFSTHPEIARMQGVMRQQVQSIGLTKANEIAGLAQNVRRFSESNSMELTQRGNIQEALAWREWGEELFRRPEVIQAQQLTRSAEARERRESAPPPVQAHPSVQGAPTELIRTSANDFVDTPRAFVLGNEPSGSERRVIESRPSAAGSGHTLLQGRLRLVDEEDTLSRYTSRWSSYRSRSHLYVPRLQVSPLPGQTLGKSLVVFDLFKRGTGNRREIIRTDRLILPPIESGTVVVVDSGVYEYNSSRYRSNIGGYRRDQATADEFHGFIVSIFDEQGNLLYQRGSDRGLDSFARNEPPAPPEPRSPSPPPHDQGVF